MPCRRDRLERPVLHCRNVQEGSLMQNRARSGRWVREGNTITLFGLYGNEGTADRAVGPELEFETGSHPTLRRGSTGTSVRDLKTRLLSLGINPGPVDGIFGSLTEAAVKSVQRSRRLTVDGIVGPQTWGALDSGAKPAPPPRTPVTPTVPSIGDPVNLQTILAAMTRKRYTIFTEP